MPLILEKEKVETPEEALRPNRDTLEACQELKEGKGVSFTSIDELFKYLKN